MVQEFTVQPQRETLQVIQDKEKAESLLKEESGIRAKRIKRNFHHNLATRDGITSVRERLKLQTVQRVRGSSDSKTSTSPSKEQRREGLTPETRWLAHSCDLQNHVETVFSVKDALPAPAAHKLHDLEPGDWVVIRDLRRKNWRARRWNGPFQVLLTTETAVKITERATWVHASHCKRVPEPADDTSQSVLIVE
ncbi:uncharacterized protein LOC119030483 isoform X2 [Acanthopagrus latus]|nr:uncharacterized protein LOC119030483 isoform X2 [Acanthopagrus latus]XP_036974010.1 uncharacterized protein LOC119030483 isoform X2 [Acanthopagrus latus]